MEGRIAPETLIARPILVFSMAHPSSPPKSRYRSVPYRAAFYRAVIWTFLHFFCLLGTLVVAFFFFFHRAQVDIAQYKRFFMLGMAGTVVTLVISHYQRRTARCPLCIGTPLMNTGALAHKKAHCIGPLNQGHSAIVSIIFTQKFRCMYCGTRYDLLRTPRNLRGTEESSMD